MMNIPYNNYKTQKCKYYDQEKLCRFGKHCTYAHGSEEMRQPYEELPPEALPRASLPLEISMPKIYPRFFIKKDSPEVR